MSTSETDNAFDRFLDAAFVEMMLESPELPTHMGIFEAGGVACPQNRFSDVGEAANDRRMELLRNLAARLASFRAQELSSAQRIGAEVFEFFLRYAQDQDWLGIDGAPFIDHRSPLRPSVGLQTELPLFLADRHPFRHEGDAEDYLLRVRQIPTLITEATAYSQRQRANGISLPGFVMDDTIDELAAFVTTPPNENPIFATFTDKTARLNDLRTHHRASLQRSVLHCLERDVYPAYEAASTAMKQLRGGATDSPGLWALPDGDAYYQFLLRGAVTTLQSADEIHELGLLEVARMRQRIDAEFRASGFTGATIAAYYQKLERTRVAALGDTPANRAVLLDEARTRQRLVEARLPEWFRELPRANAVIEAIPAFAEHSRNHTYHPPAADGSRPGVFELNLKHLLTAADRNLATLVYHELWPGHHLQLGLALENRALPLLRRMITFDAYIEGWAKYAETLPGDQGVPQTDAERLFALRAELISTVNLVLDTGLHAKRWTREQAIDYFTGQTGMGVDFATYVVHRSASVPAQLCSYKIGLLKMRELKARQQSTSGARFDLKEFHDMVLRNGALPLAVLDDVFAQAPANRSEA
jgi:uncharacterized protein (DUF885 family)